MGFIPNQFNLFSFILTIIINTVYIFFKNKKSLVWPFTVNTLIINVIIGFIIYLFSLKESNSDTSIYFLIILITVSLITILSSIFLWIKHLAETRKLQTVFNIFVTLFMVAISFLFYQSNTFNKGIIDFSIKRVQVLEDKLGGEKNLKCNQSETFKKISHSVVRIVGGVAEGSGFVVNDNGYIVTNFHVIETEPAPKVVFFDSTMEVPEILYTNRNADLAILKVMKKLPAINWTNSNIANATDEVLLFGYPFGGDLYGSVTVSKGLLSAKRKIIDQGLEYLQTDATLNPGMSGGPMTTICGDFIGINTLGSAGMGMAISSNSFKQKYLEMSSSKEPLKDLIKVDFKPNESPLETVKAFYNYIKIRKLDKAYELLTDNFLEGGSFEQWKKGYAPNLDTTVIKIEVDPKKENIVNVKLATKDLLGDQFIRKYFEGTWEVKEIDRNLKLWWPQIKEIKEPDFTWFYE